MKTALRLLLILSSSLLTLSMIGLLDQYTNIDDTTITLVSVFVAIAFSVWVVLFDAHMDESIEISKLNLDIAIKDLIISSLEFALVKSEVNPTPERKGKDWAKGTKHSEETKRKISEKAKAREKAKREAKGPTEVKITPRKTRQK